MAFKFDSKKAEGDFKLLPEGTYEVFPTAGTVSTSSGGNEMLTVNYKVRDDVEQEGQGTEIRFDRFVDTEKAHWRIHALLHALEVEEGFELDEDDLMNDLWGFMKGKALQVVVKHEEATTGKNKGKVFPQVSGFKATEVGGQAEFEDEKPSDPFSSGGSIDISDSDLPF